MGSHSNAFGELRPTEENPGHGKKRALWAVSSTRWLHPNPEEQQRFAAANIPVGYYGDPEDIAYLIAFLASPLARYITGELISVDGGMHRFAY
jgi:NAD(P)-dependent dehydrogenase (short-subunit alcohol dehydrogenase family)